MLIALFTILFLSASSTGLLDYIAESRDNVKGINPRKDDLPKLTVPIGVVHPVVQAIKLSVPSVKLSLLIP